MTAERVFTITRPTGFQVQVRPLTHGELRDGMAAHGWPWKHIESEAQEMFNSTPGFRLHDSEGWTVRHG